MQSASTVHPLSHLLRKCQLPRKGGSFSLPLSLDAFPKNRHNKPKERQVAPDAQKIHPQYQRTHH